MILLKVGCLSSADEILHSGLFLLIQDPHGHYAANYAIPK